MSERPVYAMSHTTVDKLHCYCWTYSRDDSYGVCVVCIMSS